MTENASTARTPDVAALAGRFASLVGRGLGAQALVEAMALPSGNDDARVARALCWSLLGNSLWAEEELSRTAATGLSPAGDKAYRALVERTAADARVAREAVARRRDENLAVLAEHQPDLAERFRGAALDPSTTWARIGEALVLVDLSSGSPRFVVEEPSQAEVERLSRAVLQAEPPLLGEMRCGVLLSRLAAVRPGFANGRLVPIYVLEPSTARFVFHLSLGSFRDYTGEGNARFFVGSDAVDRFLAALREDPFLPIARTATYAPPSMVARIEGFTPEAAAELQDRRASLDRHYGAMTPRRILDRLDGRNGEPPRVLFITSRFTTVLQYVTRDLAQAFESLGWRSEVLKETSRIGWYSGRPLARAMDGFRPDMVFTIDHVRPEHPPGTLPSIPYICWIQDPMPQLFDPAIAAKIGDMDFTYAVVPEWREKCLSIGYREVGVLPMGVNPELFCPGPPDSRLACDVAFASHVKLPALCGPNPALLPLLVQEMLDAPIGTIQDVPYFEALLARVEARLAARVNEANRAAVVQDLYHTLPRYAYRVPPVHWAREAGLHVKVFGDGWSSIPDLGDVAGGTLGNGEPLRDLYRSAKVNLHINQGGLNLHQRVFECLASGGFLLARALPSDTQTGGLGSSFEIGREVVTFEGKGDYIEKLKRFVADDRARHEVVEAGRARVLAGHTYAHRMKVVLADVRARLERLAAGGSR